MTSVSTIKSHRLDVPQQNDCNQEEVLYEQQLLNQERNFIVHVGADCSQIKEEQEDVYISQEGEQFGLKQETQTFDEDVPQQNNFKEEEVLYEQQLLNQERNCIVVQVGADCCQIKEEQEDVCISQEGEQLPQRQPDGVQSPPRDPRAFWGTEAVVDRTSELSGNVRITELGGVQVGLVFGRKIGS
ncbi:uncharacterized protein KZ484_017808 [Pholidichthys leucotaenia]